MSVSPGTHLPRASTTMESADRFDGSWEDRVAMRAMERIDDGPTSDDCWGVVSHLSDPSGERS